VTSKQAAREARPLQIFAIAAAAFFLTGTFAYLRFPYDRLAATLSARLRELGVELEIGRLAAHLTPAGPGWVVENVHIVRPDGSRFRIDSLRVRPAWSLAWLALRPALHLAGETPLGQIEGVAVLRGPQQFTGELREVDLAELLGSERLPGARLEGRASLELDLALDPEGPRGPVHLLARDGVLTHPQLPMAVHFESLEGDVVFGGEHWVEISSLDLRSPLANGTLRGTVERAADMSQAPLALDLKVQVSPEIRGSLAAQGVAVGKGGELKYQILGTASAPIIR
jgi:type II secretion system protein N